MKMSRFTAFGMTIAKGIESYSCFYFGETTPFLVHGAGYGSGKHLQDCKCS